MTNYIARGRQVVVPLTNKSAGSVAAGDTVILSSGTAAAFTTTTSAGQVDDFVGVVYDATIAQDAIGLVILQGFVPLITLSGSASLGDYVKTHSVAKQSAPSATRGSGSFGQVLGTGTTPAAFIWGFPDPATAAGNVATDAIWDAAGDLVQGTGADAAARLALGTANQVLRVNAGATAAEWASLGRVLISEQTPTSTGTVTFNSIPGTYKSLMLEFVGRTDKAGQSSTSCNLRFNNDTTDGNYQRQTLNGGGSSASAGTAANPDAIVLTAATATANYPGYGTIFVPFYALTTFIKAAEINNLYATASNSENLNFQFVSWHNTAAITRIDIVTDDSSNYITGTTFRLYGVY